MKNPKNIFGFTLVELIVVITIVGILSTVGFVSYSGYLAGARDSNRFSQLTKLSDSLQVYAATKSLPLPDDYIEVTASGTVIAYQGYVGVDVLETIDYTNGGKDPKDESYYTYYVSKNRKNMQLLAFMEEQSSVTLNAQIYAADYSERVPMVYGKKLGVLVSAETTTLHTPAQEVSLNITNGNLDIQQTTSSYQAIISNQEAVTGTGTVLAFLKDGAAKSCVQILRKKGTVNSGIYTINPDGQQSIEVYCDMETNGGGWTFFGHYNSNSNGSTFSNFFNTTIGVYSPERVDDNTIYSIDASKLGHTEMMATLDGIDISDADSNNKIIFYSYPKNHPGFYTGPIPCSGLSQVFQYKITKDTGYTKKGATNNCGSNNWYTRTSDNSLYLALFHGTSGGNYWGSGMGGNNTWGHDGWWYVR